MAEGIIVVKGADEAVFCNAAARDLFEFGETELTHKHLEAKLKELGLHSYYEQAKLMKGETVTRDVVLGDKKTAKDKPQDEKPQDVRLRCYMGSMPDGPEKQQGRYIIFRNISEEKEAEKKKSDFIGTVSHELRTPITAMGEFSALMLEGVAGALNDQQKEYLGIIKENVDRIRAIVDRLLDITDIETQKVELKREVVNIGDLISDVAILFKPKAASKNILVRTVIDGVSPNLFVDRGLVVQILINLLENAVQFTKEWGKIWIQVRDVGQEVEICVKDTGIGIAADKAHGIFDRFSQLDKGYGAGAKGVGLGLAICKDLVQMHQGTIRVESEPEKGSSFILTLPKHDQGMLIKESLSDALSQARRQHRPLSYMIVKVSNYEELEKEYKAQGAEEIVGEIWRLLRGAVRTPQDKVAIIQKSIAGAIQPNINKGAALAVQKRIEDHLTSEKLSWKGKSVVPEVTFKVITYPDDASTVAEMRLLEERST